MWIKKPIESGSEPMKSAEPVKADEPNPTAAERRRKAMYDQTEIAEIMRQRATSEDS